MTSATKKAKAKLRTRAVSLIVMRLIEPGTGELIPCLVPSHPIDRRSLRERKFYVGKVVRADLVEDRNPGFWRKAHVLGGWLADNVEAFAGLGMHDALKRLQELSGVGVEVESLEVYVEALRSKVTGTRTVAESLNFQDMDEGRFNELWSGADGEGGWIGWLRREVFGGLDAAAREEVEAIIERPQQ